MNKAQNIYGNLALKPIAEHTAPKLTIVEPSHEQKSGFESFAHQVFAPYETKSFGNRQTARAYDMAGRPMLKTRQERRFAYIACALATVAVFYFSFFAFM